MDLIQKYSCVHTCLYDQTILLLFAIFCCLLVSGELVCSRRGYYSFVWHSLLFLTCLYTFHVTFFLILYSLSGYLTVVFMYWLCLAPFLSFSLWKVGQKEELYKEHMVVISPVKSWHVRTERQLLFPDCSNSSGCHVFPMHDFHPQSMICVRKQWLGMGSSEQSMLFSLMEGTKHVTKERGTLIQHQTCPHINIILAGKGNLL